MTSLITKNDFNVYRIGYDLYKDFTRYKKMFKTIILATLIILSVSY